MRRLLSILLVAFFGLAPAAALMPSSDEAHLPPCCRRHGAHHCTMGGATQATADSTHQLAAPAHCPRYNLTTPASTGPFAAAERPQLHDAWQRRAATAAARSAETQRARSCADRGPPAHALLG